MTEQEVFLQAIAKSSGVERRAFVDQICGSDATLRRRVEALLLAHEGAADFLDEPVFGPPTTNVPAITEATGSTVGPYRLLQRIGEGGFGVVYMAEQTEPVRRKVALKIIKPGMDTKEVIARFESERQALALMDHPNIAHVLDAGSTESGHPYFVMELVKGVPITEFCDRNKLSVQDRLTLFMPVCLAVQHAHHKGVIHRDIKPSNVMVTLHDGRPVPKVIDFGVAKATSQQLTQRTLFTAYGQMIGTPMYMSPEQAEMSGLDIDTRSDIYSLGVLLYELLTGTTPIEQKKLREAGLIEMQRLIREVEAPRPSTRLSTLREEASIICTNRNTDAQRLGDLLRGDVDWIVMKALEKDRQRRYDTPTAFADDIRRYLTNEAIHARPPSAPYRLRKFVQRNRTLAVGIGAVAATLLLGAVVSTGFAIHANSQWHRALQAETGLQASLTDTQRERKNAEDQRRMAEKERDRAVTAEQSQAELTQLAQERLQDTERARMAETEQRQLAEQQHLEAERQKEEAVRLSTQLTASNEEQRRAIYAAEMNLVRIEAQRGNLQRMREILMDQLPIDGKEDLRGFEWHYWYRYMNQAQAVMKFDNFRYGQSDSVAAIVPGGELVAVTQGKQTEIRDIATGKVRSTISAQLRRELVNRTQFARGGRSIHGECDTRPSFLPDSTFVTAVSCTVYEPTGESHVFVYPEESFSHVSYLNISPDGQRIVVMGNAREHQPDQPAIRLIVWDVDSRQVLLNQVQPRELNRVAFNPEGTLLAAHVCHSSRRYANEDRDVAVVIEIASGETKGLARHNDDIESVFWLPNQQRMLMVTLGFSGNLRKELRSWTISEERPQILTRDPMPDFVYGKIDPQGRLLAITSHTVSSIQLFDTERGDLVETLHNEATNIDSLSFSNNSQQIIGCGTNGEVLSWNLKLHQDLFALRANPLPGILEGSYAFSADQEELAVVRADGAIVVRSRDGQEAELRAPIPGFARSISRLKFSADGRYLAHYSDIVSVEGAAPPPGDSTSVGAFEAGGTSRTCEMYDLQAAARLWQVVQETPFRFLTQYFSIEFTSDGSHLVVLDFRYPLVMDTITGEAQEHSLLDEKDPFTPFRLVRRHSDKRLLVVGAQISFTESTYPVSHRIRSARTVIKDALTWTTVAEPRVAGMGYGVTSQQILVVIPSLSPDEIHLGAVRSPLNEAEIWNLPEEKLLVSAPGLQIVFSDDGCRAAILQHRSPDGVASTSAAIVEVTLWELPSGRPLGRISLAGNLADEVRFSPDGRRLLTLHGKTLISTTTGSTPSIGRLWDVESGKEILSMPVAEQNHYEWEMLFDPTGMQLTSLVFGKGYTTDGGGGNSISYDGTPLSADKDAQLIADRLLELLLQQTPDPAELVSKINSRTALRADVRRAALAAVDRLGTNGDGVAEACLEILAEFGHTEATLDRALRWANTLHAREPESVRSRALLGGAQYFKGHIDAAVATLSAIPQSQSETTDEFEFLGKLFLLLAKQKAGAPQEEWPTLDQSPIPMRIAPGNSWNRSVARITSHARRFLLASPNRSTSDDQDRLEAADRIQFVNMDKNSDGMLTESDNFWGSTSSWKAYEPFDQNTDNALSLDEYLVSQRVVRLISTSSTENADPAKTLANLSTAISLAPHYRTALNRRAWLLATLPDDTLRDGKQAVINAILAYELSEVKYASLLDTLAAAHAEAGNFDEAVRWAEQALDKATVSTHDKYRSRLELYRMKQPYREAYAPSNVVVSNAKTISGPSSSAPLIPPDVVAIARRIPGGYAAWSPDSRKIIRNASDLDLSISNLEIFDLESDQTTVLCQGGIDAAWSTAPDGKIAFVKFGDQQSRGIGTEQLWLVNPDGSDLRKLTDGGFPSWTRDNRLFYRKVMEDKLPSLFAINVAKPESPLWSRSRDFALHPAVSKDGSMIVRIVAGRLSIHRLDPPEELVSLPLGSPTELGLADFSPDGEFVVYGRRTSSSQPTQSPGVWLIEVATGHWRLLAQGDGTLPRWSPDGRFISIDRRIDKEIVLLDVSQLDLSQGLQQARPLPVKFTQNPVAKSHEPEGQPVP